MTIAVQYHEDNLVTYYGTLNYYATLVCVRVHCVSVSVCTCVFVYSTCVCTCVFVYTFVCACVSFDSEDYLFPYYQGRLT